MRQNPDVWPETHFPSSESRLFTINIWIICVSFLCAQIWRRFDSHEKVHLVVLRLLNWYVSLHLCVCVCSSWRSPSSPVRLQSKLVSPWRWRLKICTFRWKTSPRQNRRSVQLFTSSQPLIAGYLQIVLHIVAEYEEKAFGSDHQRWSLAVCFEARLRLHHLRW